MFYMLTPLHRHFDLGFGAVADSFKDIAESPGDEQSYSQNQHLPVSFLYRHAIELYLKSAIIIFHKRLNLPFSGKVSEPEVLVNGKWAPMYRVHAIGDLYEYFRKLFNDHASFLTSNTNTDWSFPDELSTWIATIEEHDSSSTYFRYPATRHKDLDQEKSSFKATSVADIFARMGPDNRPVKAFLLIGDNHEVIEAYEHDRNAGLQLLTVLKSACQVFHDCNAAMRGELTGGW